MQELRC